MARIVVGETFSETYRIEPEHSAERFGNDGVDVASTPAIIGLLEQASLRCLRRYIGEHESSVGTRVDIEHLAAAPIGARIEASVTITGAERKRVTFDLEARWNGTSLMRGKHERAIVERARFLERLPTLDA